MDLRTLIIVIFFSYVLLMIVLAWWVNRTIAKLPATLEVGLEAKQDGLLRKMLIDLNDGLGKQGALISTSQLDAAERLRSSVSDELGKTRSTLQRLELDLQTKQDALQTAMLGGMLEKLAEQSRAEQELIQSTLHGVKLQINSTIEALTKTTDARLNEIGGKVNERLDEGFKKTNETFVNVMARLATIDEAQKKIDGLTTNVVSLQQLLGDKRSRGAFGEMQLETIVRNVLPESAFEFQYTFPNKVRADCVLKLPEPTGLIAVDSKFPLENYERMLADAASTGAFKSDVKKHIDDIAGKYIIPGVTSEGAMMFLPAEAVSAEIYAHHLDIIEYAGRKHVWIVSPTTMMAVLNTTLAVLRDVETRKQAHVIKDALGKLGADFGRFQSRMDDLAKHIGQANHDVEQVHKSSKKISEQFQKIERVELEAAVEKVDVAPTLTLIKSETES